MSAYWFLVGLNIISWILIPIFVVMVWEIQALKYTQVWYCYLVKEKPEVGKYSKGLTKVGTYVGMREDKKRGRYELIFRRGVKLHYYCAKMTADTLKSLHLIHKYLIVRYLMDLQVYEHPLPEDQWFERKEVYPFYYNIYLFFRYAFSFCDGLHGAVGPIVMVFVAYIYNPTNFLLGGLVFLVGIGISMVVTWLFRAKIIEVKPQKRVVKSEWWIGTIFPEEVLESQFDAEFSRKKRIKRNDGTSDTRIEAEIAQGATLDHIEHLRMDPEVTDFKFKWTGYVKKRIAVEDIKILARTFPEKCRVYLEENHDLYTDNLRLQQANLDLQRQLQAATAKTQDEIDRFNREILALTQGSNEAIKNALAEIFTMKRVNASLDATNERAIQKYFSTLPGGIEYKVNLILQLMQVLVKREREAVRGDDLQAALARLVEVRPAPQQAAPENGNGRGPQSQEVTTYAARE